jgi:hypothetical protein
MEEMGLLFENYLPCPTSSSPTSPSSFSTFSSSFLLHFLYFFSSYFMICVSFLYSHSGRIPFSLPRFYRIYITFYSWPVILIKLYLNIYNRFSFSPLPFHSYLLFLYVNCLSYYLKFQNTVRHYIDDNDGFLLGPSVPSFLS